MTHSSKLPAGCLRALDESLRPDLFQALCDPIRIALVAHLAASGRSLTVTEASACCGIHFSGVSRHLAILRRAAVVRAEKRGRETHYALEAGALISSLRGIADALETCCAQAGRSAEAVAGEVHQRA